MAAAQANAVTLARAKDARGSLFAQGAAPCLPSSEAAGQPRGAGGVIWVPLSSHKQVAISSVPRPRELHLMCTALLMAGLDGATFKGPSNPNYSMIP